MDKKKNTENEIDVLDQIKEIEKKKRQLLLVKSIKRLKKIAKATLLAKKEMEYFLDEMSLSKEDKKRVIDFINSCDEVVLTEEEKEKIKKEVKSSLSSDKNEIEDKMTKELSYSVTTNNNKMTFFDPQLKYSYGNYNSTGGLNNIFYCSSNNPSMRLNNGTTTNKSLTVEGIVLM